jgi:hypothetical protein
MLFLTFAIKVLGVLGRKNARPSSRTAGKVTEYFNSY